MLFKKALALSIANPITNIAFCAILKAGRRARAGPLRRSARAGASRAVIVSDQIVALIRNEPAGSELNLFRISSIAAADIERYLSFVTVTTCHGET